MDKELKKKLEELDPQFDPKHWGKMASRLDQEGITPLEGAIGAKLDSISPDLPKDAWAKFESARDAKLEQEWDDKVRDKLFNEMERQPQWGLMSQKMEAWAALRRRYITLRTGEVIIILLLLLTFHQYEGIWMPKPMASHSAESFTPGSALNDDKPTRGQEISSAAFEKEKSGHNESLVGAIRQNSGDLTVNTDPSKNTSNLTTTVVETQSSEGRNYEQGKPSHGVGPAIPSDSKELTDKKTVAFSISSQPLGTLQQARPSQWVTDRVPSLDMWKLTFGNKQPDLYPMVKDDLIRSVTPTLDRSRWLSVYGFGGLNQIRTPSDERFESKTAYSWSYGTGIELSFQQERLTWGFGLEYQVTVIQPDRSIRIGDNSTGFITATFEQVDLDFINIPLHFRYEFIDRPVEDWYAYGGIRLHMSSSIRYSFDTVLDGPPPPGDFDLEDAKELHNVSETNFTYFTLSAGAGYQRILNERWTFFGQAGLDLFGQNSSLFPNREVIHILRTDLGLRYGF